MISASRTTYVRFWTWGFGSRVWHRTHGTSRYSTIFIPGLVLFLGKEK